MQSSDSRQIIVDGRWLQRSAEKLHVSADGARTRWQGPSMEVNTEGKVGSELGVQVGICRFGERVALRYLDVQHEFPKFS